MVFVFGNCELDLEREEIRRAGEPRHVEPQVFAVLSYLLEHRERLVSKEELLDRIWEGRIVTPATLNSRLKAVRQAIGDDGTSQQVIQTVRGRGFRFVAPVRLREHSGSATPRRAVEPDLGDLTAPSLPPLIARSAELDQLAESLRTACAGARQLVFLTGEPGIGKSTLAEGFLDRVPQGVRIARGQCVEQRGAGEPYLPVLDALGRLCRSPGGEEVIAQLETLAPSWLLQMPSFQTEEQLESARRRSLGASRERMLREMVEALEALTRNTALVLLLEDLHWSARSTLHLLVWLAQRPEPTRLLVLGTFRGSDADAELREAITQARRSGRVVEISLERWSESDVREYCEHQYPARPLPVELLHLVHRRAEGNPLFVRTLIDAWIESGALVEDEQGWRPAETIDELASGIPGTLRMLLDQRIEQLSAEDQHILEVGSVIGPTFATALAAAALEMEEEAVEARCHALARRGRMLRDPAETEWPDGTQTTRFAFVHHLHREALYERIPLARRSRLHRRIGERLEAAFAGEEATQAGALALHFQRGHDDARAVHYLRLSATQALRRNAHREAVGHITTALHLIRRRPDLPDALATELRLERMLAPAVLLTQGFRSTEAERAYLRSRELSEQLGDNAELAQVLHGLAYLHEIRGEFHRSQALLEQCLSMKERESGRYSSVESHELLSCSLFHQGKFDDALRNARAAMERFRPLQETDPLSASRGMNMALASHYWAALALWCLGFPDQALAPIRRSLELAEGSQLIYMQAASRIQAARLHHFRRDVPSVLAEAKAGVQIAERQGYPYHQAIALTLRGWARVQQGAAEQGLAEIRHGIRTQVDAGADMELPYGLALLAEASLQTAEIGEGLAAVDEALAIIEQRARAFFWQAELYRLRGELLLRGGSTDAAEASMRTALGLASSQGARSLELRAAMSLCRLQRDRGGSAEGRERLGAVFETFTEGRETPDFLEAAAMRAW